MLYMTGGPIRCPRSEPREEKTAFVILTLQPISLSHLEPISFSISLNECCFTEKGCEIVFIPSFMCLARSELEY